MPGRHRRCCSGRGSCTCRNAASLFQDRPHSRCAGHHRSRRGWRRSHRLRSVRQSSRVSRWASRSALRCRCHSDLDRDRCPPRSHRQRSDRNHETCRCRRQWCIGRCPRTGRRRWPERMAHKKGEHNLSWDRFWRRTGPCMPSVRTGTDRCRGCSHRRPARTMRNPTRVGPRGCEEDAPTE
jgi:hypothetical protein